MYLSRFLEERIIELFRDGSVKGTVTISMGNEATSVGMTIPFRPGVDVVSLMQRDFSGHLTMGMTIDKMVAQYMATANSPSQGREGNVHHGDAKNRRFPMISHLGDMAPTVVGGVFGARIRGEEVFGLSAIGDGGTSTGDFHEAMNFASVRKIPVIFIIQNNRYAYSTPTKFQYNCENLADRAKGYGIEGAVVDGTDVVAIYNAVTSALDGMKKDNLPRLIESKTLRLKGHAVYDKAEYVPEEERREIESLDPLPRTRARLIAEGKVPEEQVALTESGIRELVTSAIERARESARPAHASLHNSIFASVALPQVPAFTAQKVRNLNAVTHALDYILSNNPEAVLLGQDVGVYGSAFKSCKGLFEKFGGTRVIDTPICEAATTGFALGASQTGCRPIVEFQFSDFSTEATTQLGLNAGTWFHRAGNPVPILMRFPSGGGIGLGAFHSAEFEGLWSRFPGLKLLYPVTPQETFEALVAGFYDPNPCLVFEHKLLYGSSSGDINFNGDLAAVWQPRVYREGTDITILAWGAMARLALSAAEKVSASCEILNPFVLSPAVYEPLIASVKKTGRLLVVQEASVTAGIGANFISRLTQECFGSFKTAPHMISSPDMPVPFEAELEKAHLPTIEKVITKIDDMMGDRS